MCAILVCVAYEVGETRGNTLRPAAKDKFVSKVGIDAFDSFYADIYDELLFSEIKDQFEVEQIVNNTAHTESIILDVGSQMGHHCGRLAKMV